MDIYRVKEVYEDGILMTLKLVCPIFLDVINVIEIIY